MFTKKKNFITLLALLSVFAITTYSCDDDNDPLSGDEEAPVSSYFLGLEAATDPSVDVLSTAASLDTGTVSPINNGFEQPAWMTFLQGEDEIIVTGYTSAPEFVKYELVNGELVEVDNFFVELTTYAYDFVDESNMVTIASAREGLTEKVIYHANLDDMALVNTVNVDFGNDSVDSLLAFPTDMKVRGDKLFISYYMIAADGSFATPNSEDARVAVFSYPGLEFEKIITDDRAPNIGRYYSTNALEIDELGDIYTFSSSSLACGYYPTPQTPSGILRINDGETEFDENFHIDFEALSGGYKINDMFYVANGKAVVRVLLEDETNLNYLWATYAPTSSTPLLYTGIVDLYNGTFTLLDNVPMSGGGWNSAYQVDGSKLYLGVSNSEYAGIYVIDTETNTATEGAVADANYIKGILSLSTEE